jgi:restriction system protein
MLQQAFTPLVTEYWWLIPTIIVIGFFRTPYIKGLIGELQINFAAKHFLDKAFYTVFNNVTLLTEDGTTQIDHIIVSRYGIFVIETKNMKGWIFGNAHQDMWTQQLYRHKNQFQNPLRQNYKHTQTLQSALQIDKNKLFSLIVFIGDSQFKTPMPENVIDRGYITYIKRKKEVLLSELDVQLACEKITSDRLAPTRHTHVDHIKHIKKKHPRHPTNNTYKIYRKAILLIAFGIGSLWALMPSNNTATPSFTPPHTKKLNKNPPLNNSKNTLKPDIIITTQPQELKSPATDDDPHINPSQWDFISSKDQKCWFHKKTRRKVCELLH